MQIPSNYFCVKRINTEHKVFYSSPGRFTKDFAAAFWTFLFPDCWLEYDKEIKQSIIVSTLKGPLLLFFACLHDWKLFASRTTKGQEIVHKENEKCHLRTLPVQIIVHLTWLFEADIQGKLICLKTRIIVEQTHCRLNKKQTPESKNVHWSWPDTKMWL